jgi:hypothetical protein
VPARNIYHDIVVQALTADGWTITDDPLRLSYGGRDLFVDLGAERRTLAAEKAGQKIAVEIQSFLNPSPVRATFRKQWDNTKSTEQSSNKLSLSGGFTSPCLSWFTRACSPRDLDN